MRPLSLRAHGLSGGIIPLLILLNLCITVPLAAILNIWIDEAFSLHTSGGGLVYAARHALNFEMQPPLYFVLLNLWRSANASPFFARLFSIVCIALTIPLVGKIAKRFFKDIHPGWIAASVALNPFVIWAAVEIRMYAFVLLLSSLLLLFFHDGYLCDSPRGRAQWYYVVTAVLALYTQYYLGFLLVANACALLVLGRWQALRKYLTGMLITAVCFVPLVQIVRQQVGGVTAPANNAGFSLADGLRAVYWNILRYLLPVGEIEWLSFMRKWISRLGLIMVIFLFVRGYRRFTLSRHVTLWTIVTVLFISFTMVSMSLGEELLKLRHTAVIFLPTVLGIFSLLTVSRRKEMLISASLVMACFYTISFVDAYTPMAKNGDWSQVASYIMSYEKSGEPILIFRNEFALPLSLYYRGKNEVVPIPNGPNLDRYDLQSQVLRNGKEIFNALSSVSPRRERLWIVTGSNEPFRGVDFHPEILEGFVNKYCSVIESKKFYRSRVRLLNCVTPQILRTPQYSADRQSSGLPLANCLLAMAKS